jgi:hypothetical protein
MQVQNARMLDRRRRHTDMQPGIERGGKWQHGAERAAVGKGWGRGDGAIHQALGRTVRSVSVGVCLSVAVYPPIAVVCAADEAVGEGG